MKFGITMLIFKKDDIQFATEFPFFWDTLYNQGETCLGALNSIYYISKIKEDFYMDLKKKYKNLSVKFIPYKLRINITKKTFKKNNFIPLFSYF